MVEARTHQRLLTAGALLIALVVPPEARAAEEGEEGKKLLADVARAYQELDGYRDEGTLSLMLTNPVGEKQVYSHPMALGYHRPNHLAVDVGVLAITSDETTMTIINRAARVISTRKYPASKGDAAKPATSHLRTDPSGLTEKQREQNKSLIRFAERLEDSKHPDLAAGAVGAVPASLLLTLLLDPDPAAILARAALGIVAEPDRKDRDKTYRVLRLDFKDAPGLRLSIDPEDHLIRRMEFVFTREQRRQLAAAALEAGGIEVAWSAGAIVTGAEARVAAEKLRTALLDTARNDRYDTVGGDTMGGFPNDATAIVPTTRGRGVIRMLMSWFQNLGL